MRAGQFIIALSLLGSGCLPQPHDLIGRSCTTDADCGPGLVCYRQACATAGSHDTFTLDTPALVLAGADEGGAVVTPAGASRLPTAPGLLSPVDGTPLSSARSGHAAVSVAGHVFVLGGTASGTATAEVLDVGVLESRPQVPGPALPSPRWGHAAVAAAGRVFVLGGRGADGSLLSEVVSAALQADGTLGAWETEPPLPSGRASLGAVAAGGLVYAVGGQALSGTLSEVLAAPLDGKGRLGPFLKVGSLPASSGGARASFAAALFDGWLYLAGGVCAAGNCPTTRAALQPDGSLGAFETLADLPERLEPASAVAGGAWHLFGGRRGTGVVLADSVAMPLDGAGRASWLQQPVLPQPLTLAAAVAVPSGVMLTGGQLPDGGASAQTLLSSSTVGGLSDVGDQPEAPVELQNSSATIWNGGLFLAGRVVRDGEMDELYRSSSTMGDGGLASWAVAGRLSEKAGEVGLAAWGARLYTVGRCLEAGNGNCLGTDTVEVADVFGDGGVGAFRPLAPLPAETAAPGIAVVNGWLYVVGGSIGYYDAHSEVRMARIDPLTGDLGAWRETTPLPLDGGLRDHATAAIGDVLYVVGGSGAAGYSNRVLSARVAPDGTVGPWALAGLLPEQRSDVSATAFDDVLYVAGGCNEDGNRPYCGNHLGTVLSAPVRLDGGLGEFSVAGRLSALKGMAAASFHGRLVTAGGYDGNPQRWVQSADYQARGTVGLMAPMSALPEPRGSFASAAHQHWVFAVGGDGAPSSVSMARSSSAGVAAWQAGPMLPAPRSRLSAAVLGDRLYVAGGADPSSAPTDTVWSASISTEGLGAWRVEASLPTAVAGLALAASGSALYATGGAGSAAVFVSNVGVDGVLAGWQRGPELPAARASHRALVTGGQLWVVGGVADGDRGDVLTAALAADGSVGEWRQAIGLPGPRASFGAAAVGGVLYVAGGAGAQGAQADVLAATVRPDGTLGSWTEVGTLSANRAGLELVAVDGWLVSLGGEGAAQVEAAPLLTAPARATYALRVDLGQAVKQVETLTLSGSAGPGAFRVDARFAAEDGAFGSWVPLGLTRPGQELSVGQAARYLWLKVTLDDSSSTSGPLPGVVRDLTGISFSLAL